MVPRDSLRAQAEETLADPICRAAIDHAIPLRAADKLIFNVGDWGWLIGSSADVLPY